MRRYDREMCYEDTAAALASGKWGVLSMWDGEEPYGVPVNYVYSQSDGAIFFHCAKEGRKLDIINFNNKVSFAVVSRERIIPERFTTLYESIIVSGKASVVEDEDEKLKRLIQLCEALTPENIDGRDPYIKKYLSETTVIRIDIENISGKRNID
jgi:nitroimidazol reductase NimA-like FMN-containing flavoprotein (pyridoxamine 5'-phosphate oxidase superfamily)